MKLSLTALALVALCATPAFAEHTPGHKAKHSKMVDAKINYFFDKADVDHDGKLNKIEHEAAANSMFRLADTNGDGLLTKAEVKRHHESEMRQVRKDLGWDNPDRSRDDRDDDRDDRDERY